MKKIVCFLLAVGMLFLVGCHETEKPVETTKSFRETEIDEMMQSYPQIKTYSFKIQDSKKIGEKNKHVIEMSFTTQDENPSAREICCRLSHFGYIGTVNQTITARNQTVELDIKSTMEEVYKNSVI